MSFTHESRSAKDLSFVACSEKKVPDLSGFLVIGGRSIFEELVDYVACV
jgi:hypothetical protein